MKKGGAKVGDVLILTKPLGTGILTTAGKNGVVSANEMENAIRWMMKLNRDASHAAVASGTGSATDITGYSLLGHAYEMAFASNTCFEIHADSLPILEGAPNLARRADSRRHKSKPRLFARKGVPTNGFAC